MKAGERSGWEWFKYHKEQIGDIVEYILDIVLALVACAMGIAALMGLILIVVLIVGSF